MVVAESPFQRMPQTLRLTIGISSVCLLAKYLRNHWKDFGETLRMQQTNVRLKLFNFRSQSI